MRPDIAVLDPKAAGPVFDSALELSNILAAEVDPDGPPHNEHSFRAYMRGNETFEKPLLVASVDGRALGMAWMRMFHIEGNTEKADTKIGVHPDHRRLGIGTDLLRAVLDVCEANRRTNLTGDGVTSAAMTGFWGTLGVDLGFVERESRLWLAHTDPALMTQWIERRTERAGEYSLIHFRGRTPGNLLTAMAAMMTAMNDAPVDELDINPEVWTEADVVELDNYYDSSELERWSSLILAPDGTPTALTVVSFSPHIPKFANQGDTVVLDTHRNRGLGRWVKADMWQRLRASAPDIEAIDAENAQSNAPMLAINEGMGFEARTEIGYWQADVADLRHTIASR
jgi:GNAT superfamily N-acetyltransferase